MNQKPTTTKTIILLLIALVGVVGYLVKTEKISLPGFGADNETRGWETYRNEKYGFEFKYPKEITFRGRIKNIQSLIIKEYEANRMVSVETVSGANLVTFSIKDKLSDFVTLEAYVQNLAKGREQERKRESCHLCGSMEVTPISMAGLSGFAIIESAVDAPTNTGVGAYFDASQHLINIGYSYPAAVVQNPGDSDYALDAVFEYETIQKVISTFKLVR